MEQNHLVSVQSPKKDPFSPFNREGEKSDRYLSNLYFSGHPKLDILNANICLMLYCILFGILSSIT